LFSVKIAIKQLAEWMRHLHSTGTDFQSGQAKDLLQTDFCLKFGDLSVKRENVEF